MKQENQESVGDRILQIRAELGRPSQERFGRSLGVTKSTVSQWELGKTEPSPENLFAIESVYGYRAKWILDGELPKLVRELNALVYEPSNVSYGPAIRGMVPLISWVSAGRWREPDVTLEPPLEWVPFVGTNPHTFALRVQGDSMEPDYPQGHIIIVDPEIPADPMDLVVALNGDGEATFKRLTRENGEWFLMPINPRYQPHKLDSLCKIIGVVVWSGKKEKCLR
ncbi:MAG: S24 family peptidase [Nitrosomonas ureae]